MSDSSVLGNYLVIYTACFYIIYHKVLYTYIDALILFNYCFIMLQLAFFGGCFCRTLIGNSFILDIIKICNLFPQFHCLIKLIN